MLKRSVRKFSSKKMLEQMPFSVLPRSEVKLKLRASAAA